MKQALFLRNKLIRQIKMNGKEYTFYRYGEDDYKQRNQEPEEISTVFGVFHKTNSSDSYLMSKVSDATQISAKPKPMMLLLYEDGLDLQKDDFVMINEKQFKVVTKQNVQELNIAFEVSLEVAQDE